MSRPYVARVNEGGNFCGHNPGAPRVVMANPASRKIPLILRRCIERMQDYYHRPATLPSLNAANGSDRRQRSERRESCLLVLQSILKFTDVASLRCGIPTEKGFAGLTIATLANHAGVGLRRAERAVANLKAAGLLTVSAIVERQSDGSYVGVAAVKAVSRHLWAAFGLADMLKHERDKASKRATKARRAVANVTTRAGARAALALGSLKALLPTPRRPDDPERRRRVAMREVELRLQHPDWPTDKVRYTAAQDTF